MGKVQELEKRVAELERQLETEKYQQHYPIVPYWYVFPQVIPIPTYVVDWVHREYSSAALISEWYEIESY